MPPAASPVHVLLLHGEESFLVNEEARRTLAEWRKALVSDFGFEALDPGGLTGERLRDAILQGPFLDPYRVVAVRGLAVRRADPLAPALKEVPETTRLLLAVNGRLAPASRLVKAVAAAGGQAQEHKPIKGRALQDWVQARAREHQVPPAAAAAVARLGRPDLGVMDSELQKLGAYRASGHQLDQKAVLDLLAGGRPQDIFRLTDHLLPRPDAEAWRVLRDLLDREQPTVIAYRLARHLALVLEVRTRQDRGETVSQAQAAMREHPFVVQKAFDAARSTTPDRLEAGLRALLDYEWEVKSGQIDSEAGLVAVLAKL
jgi:DNA polymerase III delta subunit